MEAPPSENARNGGCRLQGAVMGAALRRWRRCNRMQKIKCAASTTPPSSRPARSSFKTRNASTTQASQASAVPCRQADTQATACTRRWRGGCHSCRRVFRRPWQPLQAAIRSASRLPALPLPSRTRRTAQLTEWTGPPSRAAGGSWRGRPAQQARKRSQAWERAASRGWHAGQARTPARPRPCTLAAQRLPPPTLAPTCSRTPPVFCSCCPCWLVPSWPYDPP